MNEAPLSLSEVLTVILMLGWLTFLFGALFHFVILRVIGRLGWGYVAAMLVMGRLMAVMLCIPFMLIKYPTGNVFNQFIYIPALMSEMVVALITLVILTLQKRKALRENR